MIGHEQPSHLPRHRGRRHPHIRIGRRITIPTAKLLEQLGLPVDTVTWTVD